MFDVCTTIDSHLPYPNSKKTMESEYETTMPELVRLTSSSAEYTGRYDRPHVGMIADDRARVFGTVLDALRPFNFRLANAEVVSTGPLSDQRVIFRNPETGINFQFGAEEYSFTKDSPFWSEADQNVQALLAAESALFEASGVKVASCFFRLFMHMQPLSKTREEILASFIPAPFKEIMAQRQALAYGNHLLFEDGDLLLDFSINVANGIFLRFTSKFAERPPIADILAKIQNDQKNIFSILDIEDFTNG